MNRDTNCVPTLVSVVVPVFNGMPYLADLVASLTAQTYEDLEIVFSEGGGTDGSLDYLKTLTDQRIRIIEQPLGTSAALNWTKATQAGSGEFIKLVCQDDLLAPDAIEKQVKDLEQHPQAVMAIAQRDIVDAKGKLLYPKRGCQKLEAGAIQGITALETAYLQGTNVLGEPLAVLFRKAPLLAAMPWNDENPLVLDLACYEKVAPQGEIVVRKESIGAFRVSTSSWSTRLANEQLAQFERWQHEYSQTHEVTKSQAKQAKRNVRIQTILRRGAYSWLRLKGNFKS